MQLIDKESNEDTTTYCTLDNGPTLLVNRSSGSFDLTLPEFETKGSVEYGETSRSKEPEGRAQAQQRGTIIKSAIWWLSPFNCFLLSVDWQDLFSTNPDSLQRSRKGRVLLHRLEDYGRAGNQIEHPCVGQSVWRSNVANRNSWVAQARSETELPSHAFPERYSGQGRTIKPLVLFGGWHAMPIQPHISHCMSSRSLPVLPEKVPFLPARPAGAGSPEERPDTLGCGEPAPSRVCDGKQVTGTIKR